MDIDPNGYRDSHYKIGKEHTGIRGERTFGLPHDQKIIILHYNVMHCAVQWCYKNGPHAFLLMLTGAIS